MVFIRESKFDLGPCPHRDFCKENDYFDFLNEIK
jgi:hypothetical protein